MIQMKTTEQGFLIRDIDLELVDPVSNQDTSSDTSDSLNDLGSLLQDSTLSQSARQLAITEALNNILVRSYIDCFDILVKQASNLSINSVGWDFLFKTVKYLVMETKFREDMNSYNEKILNRLRMDIGRYFTSKSFLSNQGAELDEDSKNNIIMKRSDDVTNLRKELDAVTKTYDIITFFSTPIYRDAILTNKFVELFMVKKLI